MTARYDQLLRKRAGPTLLKIAISPTWSSPFCLILKNHKALLNRESPRKMGTSHAHEWIIQNVLITFLLRKTQLFLNDF